MATATETETVVAHPAVDPVDEKIEKLVDEVKAVEEETSTPCKDIGEEDSIKVEESQHVSSILAKSEEEEVSQKLDSPAIETKTENEAADEENDQIEPIPESQIPEDMKAIVKEAVDPPPAESIEQLIKDSSEPVDVAAPASEAEPEEKTSAGLPAELQSEEPGTAEVRDIVEPAGDPVVSIEPPGGDSVECSQEQDDQPITDQQVQGGLREDTSAEKEQDDQQSVDSVIKKEEEEPELTSVERELENKPSMEVVIREEEDDEHLTIASSEKEQDKQQPVESLLKETEEKLSEDQLAVGSVEKNPEDQQLAGRTVEEGEDQPEVEPEDQPSLSANSTPTLEVGCEPTTEMEQPVLVLPGEELEPAIVKETTYSGSRATTVESEPNITTEMEQPVLVLPGEELEPAIVKETTYTDSGATNLESEPTTTIEMEQPEPVLPSEELEPAIVKQTTNSDSGATNVDSEPSTTTEIKQPVSVLPEEELEPTIVKETTDSESGAINDETPQQEAARLDDKQAEQVQNIDEVCEPQEDAAAETVKDEGLLDVDAENTSMVKDGEVCKEVKEIENSEERVEQSESAGGNDSTPPIPESIKEEANESSTEEIFEKLPKDVVLTDEKSTEERAEQSESVGGDDSTPPVLESIKEEVDESSPAENVKKLPKDVVLTDEKSAEEDEETTLKTGEGTEGVIAQEVTTFEDVGSSLPAANVAKSSADEERSCQEVDLIAKNKIEENVKDENAAVTEPSEVECIEKTVDNLTTVTGDTTEVNTERSVELSTEEMADADQINKLDVENKEPSSKEGDESKSSENQEKVVPSKPAQKHSNNILSKVKQSLVKAKKAIIGKSPGSKNVPSETKGDIQVK